MPTLLREQAMLLLVDFQERLMPAIHDGPEAVANASRLVAAAALLEVPVLRTEQSPDKLGPTVPGLAGAGEALSKTSFDACAEPAVLAALAPAAEIVVCGCEAHVCVLQTVLGLLARQRRVVVVEDAVGSRAPLSKRVALARLREHGAEIVTTEMVVFEWLRDARDPQFRAVSKLIR